MLASNVRSAVDRWVLRLQGFITFLIAVCAATTKVEVYRIATWYWVADIVRWTQDRAWMVAVVGPILIVLLQWVRKRWGNQWADKAVQKMLDRLQEDLFGHIKAPFDQHRVTLFKYKKWGFRIGSLRHCHKGWLVPVARSNHLKKGRITKMRAPDEAEQCEGVVGLAWRCSGWVVRPQPGQPLVVPRLNGDPKVIEEYAQGSGVTAEWVRKRLRSGKRLAASYAAVAVVAEGGKLWGVIVVDSMNPESIDPNKLEKFDSYAPFLTPFLERI